MIESSLSVGPAIEPFAGGVIGLGVGYSLASRKYSLKRLLILKDDVFNKIYPDTLIKNMSEKEAAAIENIKSARKDYRYAKNQCTEDVYRTAGQWRKEFNKVEVPQEMLNQCEQNRTNLKDAIKSTDYVTLSKNYRSAKQALKQSPENEALKCTLNEANKNLSKAHAMISSKIELYKNSVKDISNERLHNIKNNPAKWVDAKDAYHEFLAALAKRRTIYSNKLFELSNNEMLKKSYDTVKDFLPRARTRSAITGGIALASVTALVTAYVNSSLRKTA